MMLSDEAIPDYYAILGLIQTASDVAIRKQYKKLALIKHPDKASDKVKATADFQVLLEAYETLIDPELREEYDILYASTPLFKPGDKTNENEYQQSEADRESANTRNRQEEKEARARMRKRKLDVLKAGKAKQKIGQHEQERKIRELRLKLEALQEIKAVFSKKNSEEQCWRTHFASLIKTPEEIRAAEEAAMKAEESFRKRHEQAESDLRRDLGRHERAAEAHRQEVIRLAAEIKEIYDKIKLEKKQEKEEARRKKAAEEAARKAEEEARFKAELERLAAEAERRRAEKAARREERKRRTVEELLELHAKEEKDRERARNREARRRERAENRDRMFKQDAVPAPSRKTSEPEETCQHQPQKIWHKIDSKVCAKCLRDFDSTTWCSHCEQLVCNWCDANQKRF